ncbi:hypothetical protein ACER0C_001878 [Sarotherodon galilaeus]
MTRPVPRRHVFGPADSDLFERQEAALSIWVEELKEKQQLFAEREHIFRGTLLAQADNFSQITISSPSCQPVPVSSAQATVKNNHAPKLVSITHPVIISTTISQPTPTPVPAPRTRAAVIQSTSAPVPVPRVGVTGVQLPPVPVPAPMVRAARVQPDPPRDSAEALQPLTSRSERLEEPTCPPASPPPHPSPNPAFRALAQSLVRLADLFPAQAPDLLAQAAALSPSLALPVAPPTSAHPLASPVQSVHLPAVQLSVPCSPVSPVSSCPASPVCRPVSCSTVSPVSSSPVSSVSCSPVSPVSSCSPVSPVCRPVSCSTVSPVCSSVARSPISYPVSGPVTHSSSCFRTCWPSDGYRAAPPPSPHPRRIRCQWPPSRLLTGPRRRRGRPWTCSVAATAFHVVGLQTCSVVATAFRVVSLRSAQSLQPLATQPPTGTVSAQLLAARPTTGTVPVWVISSSPPHRSPDKG